MSRLLDERASACDGPHDVTVRGSFSPYQRRWSPLRLASLTIPGSPGRPDSSDGEPAEAGGRYEHGQDPGAVRLMPTGWGKLAQRKSWRDFSSAQKVLTVVAGAVELVLTTIAATDLAHRDAAGVRGPKALWVPVLAVQPFGPIAYLLFGRSPSH